ncbi:MAG: ribonuclease HI [Oscillospiraceae bacterium]
MKQVTIYTDGACSGNPGPGGWGAILRYGAHEKELSGGEPSTTNNRMELLGAITALQSLHEPCQVSLYTDSQYLANAVNLGWLRGWKQKGWRRKDGELKNADLWQTLDGLLQMHKVQFFWVRVTPTMYNNRCDAPLSRKGEVCMTEPKEPKIVHFHRGQSPAQNRPATGSRILFEELLQQLPPIRKLHLEKGKLTDLVRLYPDMKRTFDAPELLSEAVIASAMVRRRMELLLFRSDDKREAGYALVTVCSPYGYVLVHALTIYPFLRGQLLGRVAIELIARCYAGKKGILYCLSRTCVALTERKRLLAKNGYRDTGFRFRWDGQPAALYLRPCQSTEDITPVAQLLLRDLYGDLLPPVNARRMIQPEA